METVDVVIVGANEAAFAAATDAARRGLRVLVVVRSTVVQPAQRLRQRFRSLKLPPRRIVVMSGAEVACIGGIHSIEAVVVRYVRSRRLVGFNAAEMLSFGEVEHP